MNIDDQPEPIEEVEPIEAEVVSPFAAPTIESENARLITEHMAGAVALGAWAVMSRSLVGIGVADGPEIMRRLQPHEASHSGLVLTNMMPELAAMLERQGFEMPELLAHLKMKVGIR
jgi:hypothetical protein